MRPGNRIDPETGQPVRPGGLTAAESRAWHAADGRRWRRWAFGPVPADGAWAMVEGIGWVRRNPKVKRGMS